MGGSLLIFSLIVSTIMIIYYWMRVAGSTYVRSNIDNNLYLVRDLPDKQEVADTLATIRSNIKKLIIYMSTNAPSQYKQYVDTLAKKFDSVVITENINDFLYTSYSVNKGEQLVFCLRSRQKTDQRHDTNLLMYVVLHEISHIACPDYGHGDSFKSIFKYITQSAIDLHIYTPIDFKNNNTEYCGMAITDSIV